MRGKEKNEKGKGKGREVEAEPLLSSSPYSTTTRYSDTSATVMEDVTDQPSDAKNPVSKEETAIKVENAQFQPSHTLREYERLFGVDEDAYEQPTTTRKELWSYYLYYNGTFIILFPIDQIRRLTNLATSGDNGVGPGSYSQALYVHGEHSRIKIILLTF